jgi:beta-glucosidase/6-phospho-beta-glucosidase/beta-galactosidase
MNKFMFATGIENSYPTIQLPDGKVKRVDEMDKAFHYKYWKTDFELLKDQGIEFLRYGPPYYSVHIGPGKYDWSFTDEAMNALKEMHITPIVDLCHFGVPDWVGNFQNSDWPEYFAEYAKAFAERFPWVKLYTPVNEIFIAAMFSAKYGWWNERLTSDKTFVTALKNLCKANLMAMIEIAKISPDCTFIQSESSEYFHPEDPSCIERAAFLNQKRFLSLDLTYGYPVNALMYEYLIDNGMTRDEYHWFHDHFNDYLKSRCVMGNDYYITNEHMVHPDGTTSASGEIYGYYVITQQYFHRYRLMVMHTETNILEPLSVDWLNKQWANAYRLKRDGVPLIGFTWYSLIDQVDWNTALREDNGVVNSLGLYDIDRKIRPVGKQFKHLIQEWTPVLMNETIGVSTY